MEYEKLKQGLKDVFTNENFEDALKDKGLRSVCAIAVAGLVLSASVRLYDHEKEQYENWEKRQPQTEQVTPTKIFQDNSGLHLN
jgi:hypothetical protein